MPLRDRYPYSSPPETGQNNDAVLALQAATATALGRTTGPVIEIGGPTRSGYTATNNLQFPNGLIISDAEEWHEDVDTLLDVRELPFPARSLGGMMMNALTLIPEEEVKELEAQYGHSGDTLDIYQHRMLGSVYPMHYRGVAYEKLYEDMWINGSLPGIFLREARQKLEPGGVIIAGTLTGHDLLLAEVLGFEVTASLSEPYYGPLDWPNTIINDEMLLTLTNMDTPAGQFIESRQSQ